MSKIPVNDVEYYFEDEDYIDDRNSESRVIRKQKTRTRRKIENFLERKKSREMLYNEDSYWGD